jgi:hypothetical protein
MPLLNTKQESGLAFHDIELAFHDATGREIRSFRGQKLEQELE